MDDTVNVSLESMRLYERVIKHIRARSVYGISLLPDSDRAYQDFAYTPLRDPGFNAADAFGENVEVMRLVPTTFSRHGFKTIDELVKQFMNDFESLYYEAWRDGEKLFDVPKYDRRLYVMWRCRPEIKRSEGGTYMYYARLALQVNDQKFEPRGTYRYHPGDAGDLRADNVDALAWQLDEFAKAAKEISGIRKGALAIKPTRMHVPVPGFRSMAEIAAKIFNDAVVTGAGAELLTNEHLADSYAHAKRQLKDAVELASKSAFKPVASDPELVRRAAWDDFKRQRRADRASMYEFHDECSKIGVLDERPGNAISRAMALPGPHDADIHTRLMPPKHQRD